MLWKAPLLSQRSSPSKEHTVLRDSSDMMLRARHSFHSFGLQKAYRLRHVAIFRVAMSQLSILSATPSVYLTALCHSTRVVTAAHDLAHVHAPPVNMLENTPHRVVLWFTTSVKIETFVLRLDGVGGCDRVIRYSVPLCKNNWYNARDACHVWPVVRVFCVHCVWCILRCVF